MRGQLTLQNEIENLYALPVSFPAELPKECIQRYTLHNEIVLDHLLFILSGEMNDDEKVKQLRLYLSIRWRVIANTSLDYTLHPHFPANIACLKMANALRSENETASQILMPSVNRILGTAFSPDNLKDITEDAEGKFDPHGFLTLVNDTELVSILDLYSLMRANPALFFSDEDSSERHEQFVFSAEDVKRIELFAGEASESYFNLLKLIFLKKKNITPSFGLALRELQIALLKGSKVKKGSEIAADLSECMYPIKQFYEMWKNLPDEVRLDVGMRKAKGSSLPLESHLLCLFAHTAGIILDQAVYDRVNTEAIVACTDQMRQQFDSILNHHPDLSSYPVHGKVMLVDGKLPTAEVLDEYETRFQNAVLNRAPLLGFLDERRVTVFDAFDSLARNAFSPSLFPADIRDCAKDIAQLEMVSASLLVLPEQYWPVFFAALNANFIRRTMTRFQLQSGFFKSILTTLHSSKWKCFFDALDEADFSKYFDASVLGAVLSEIKESEWPILFSHLESKLGEIIKDPVDLAFIFYLNVFYSWEKILSFILSYAEKILETPSNMGNFFKLIPIEVLPVLIDLFSERLLKMTHSSTALSEIIAKIDHEMRFVFLRCIAPLLKDTQFNLIGFANFLKLFRLGDYPEVLRIIGQVKLGKIFDSDIALSVFLSELNDLQRLIFLFEMPRNMLRIKVGPADLIFLLRRFPKSSQAILNVFKLQLPKIMRDLLVSFQLSDNFNEAPVVRHLNVFTFLLPKVLPIILNSNAMGDFCSSFFFRQFGMFHTMPDRAWVVKEDFKRFERATALGELSLQEGVFQKLDSLCDYLTDVETQVAQQGVFYSEICDSFGADFFPMLRQYAKRFTAEPVSVADEQFDSFADAEMSLS